MIILINNTTLNVNNAYPERDTQNGIITLFVTVPYSEMDYADLKALCKSNTEDIIKTTDDGAQEIFSGFSYASILDDEVNEVYTVKMTSDEYAFQLGRNRQLEADKATLEGAVASKDMEISTLNSTVAEKDKVIAEKEEAIAAKEGAIAERETTITEQTETIAALEAEIETLKNNVGTEVDLSEFATALEEGVNDYE